MLSLNYKHYYSAHFQTYTLLFFPFSAFNVAEVTWTYFLMFYFFNQDPIVAVVRLELSSTYLLFQETTIAV